MKGSASRLGPHAPPPTAEVSRNFFVVKARAGDPDVAFAWRLSATRKGYAGVRLEEAR